MIVRLRSPLAFDPSDVVAACVWVQRIDGINIASTTGNNVGTSSSFKEILEPTINSQGLGQNRFSRNE